MGEMRYFFTPGEGLHDLIHVGLRELVVVCDLDAFVGRVEEQDFIIGLSLFEYHDAGGNGSAEEKIGGQLDDAVDEVVVDEVLPDLLLRAAAVHDAREADDGGRAVGREPGKAVHDEGKICLALRSEHTGGSKARVVYEQRIIIARPFDGIGRIGNDQLKGLLIPMRGADKCIFTGNIEFIEAHIVQKHIDAAEVVGGDIDLLAEEAVLHSLAAKHLFRL